jgi:hypothetical protein
MEPRVTAEEEKRKYGALKLVEAHGGAELHWAGWHAGESLQGWYKSKTQARKAHAALPLLKDGVKIVLVLPVLPLGGLVA